MAFDFTLFFKHIFRHQKKRLVFSVTTASCCSSSLHTRLQVFPCAWKLFWVKFVCPSWGSLPCEIGTVLSFSMQLLFLSVACVLFTKFPHCVWRYTGRVRGVGSVKHESPHQQHVAEWRICQVLFTEAFTSICHNLFVPTRCGRLYCPFASCSCVYFEVVCLMFSRLFGLTVCCVATETFRHVCACSNNTRGISFWEMWMFELLLSFFFSHIVVATCCLSHNFRSSDRDDVSLSLLSLHGSAFEIHHTNWLWTILTYFTKTTRCVTSYTGAWISSQFYQWQACIFTTLPLCCVVSANGNHFEFQLATRFRTFVWKNGNTWVMSPQASESSAWWILLWW